MGDLAEAAKVLGDKLEESISNGFESLKSIVQPAQMIKSTGIENPELNKTLDRIAENTQPVEVPEDFTAEQRNDDQIERDERQLNFLEQIVDGFNDLGDALDDLGEATWFEKLLMLAGLTVATIIAPFSLIAGFFVGLVDSIKKIFKLIKSPIKTIKSLSKNFVNFLKGSKIVKAVDEGKKGLSRIGKVFQRISNLFAKIGKLFPITKSFTKLMPGVIKGFFGIGRFFGRLFPLFMVVTSTIDTIQGFIDGFKEGGIIGGIQGGIIGLFNSLVAIPLDLLTNAVAWIMGKFGFKNAEEILKSFSFANLFTGLFNSFFDVVGSAIDWVRSAFTWKKPSGEQTTLTEVIKESLHKILDWFKGFLDIDIQDLLSQITGYDKVKKIFTNFFKKDEEPEVQMYDIPKEQVKLSAKKETIPISEVARISQQPDAKKIKEGDKIQVNNNSTSQQTNLIDCSVDNPDKSLTYNMAGVQ